MSEPHLSARNVSKLFGPVRALNDIDLQIGPGVTGLLGPNGSGKSTLMKLFAGELLPDEGDVRLLGHDPFHFAPVRRGLGLCPEQDAFYEDLSGYDFVEALTRLNGFSAADARARTAATMKRVGLEIYGRKRIREMSRGMRQRTKIAQAIAHDPPVVLLDEPLTGADPVARADLIALVRALGQEGRCVLVSSHVLHEVEAMTHQVVFIRFGRLRAQGDVFRLRGKLEDRPYRVVLSVSGDARAFGSQLLGLAHVQTVTVLADDRLELTTTDLDDAARGVPALAQAHGVRLTRFTSPDADLESLYRYLVSQP